MNFGSWITDLIANLSVFPLCLIYLVILHLIIENSNKNLWEPAIIGHLAAPGPGLLIGFGGLMLLSKLPELIPQVIFQLKPSPFGKAIGEGLKSSNLVTKPISHYAGEEVSDIAQSVSTDASGNRITTGWRGTVGRIRRVAQITGVVKDH